MGPKGGRYAQATQLLVRSDIERDGQLFFPRVSKRTAFVLKCWGHHPGQSHMGQRPRNCVTKIVVIEDVQTPREQAFICAQARERKDIIRSEGRFKTEE